MRILLQRLSQALHCFPAFLRSETDKLSLQQQEKIEEYRLRVGHPPSILLDGKELLLNCRTVTGIMLEEILLQATGQAVYSAKEMLKNGYLTLAGGHRLGICGTAVYKEEEITFLKEVSSLNLRIASDRPGFAAAAANYLWLHPDSALIIGQPGAGKTTFLRDLIRLLSQRFHHRISICDERMELAACKNGIPQFDIGPCSDVISGARKDQGIEMLLRTMNPQWIAVDEITAERDIEAMVKASYCGVRLLATAHASGISELSTRPLYHQLIQTGIFRTVVVILKTREVQIREMTTND